MALENLRKLGFGGEKLLSVSMGSLRVRHDWATSLSLSCIGEGNGNPLQCSCLENPRDGGAWGAAVYGVPQSRTRLKRLSSSSSSLKKFFFSQVMLEGIGLQRIKKWLNDKAVKVVSIKYFTKSLVMKRQMLMSHWKWIDCSCIWGVVDINYLVITTPHG